MVAELELLGVAVEARLLDLLANAQRDPGYLARNPQGLVPALETDDGVLGQSLAIIEYLEEIHPEPALLPAEPWQRARARSLAYAIACDTHPLNNLRVLNYLTREAGLSEAGRRAWMAQWMQTTFAALEAQVDALRRKKSQMDSTAYTRELERLLLEIAEKTAAIRAAEAKP